MRITFLILVAVVASVLTPVVFAQDARETVERTRPGAANRPITIGEDASQAPDADGEAKDPPLPEGGVSENESHQSSTEAKALGRDSGVFALGRAVSKSPGSKDHTGIFPAGVDEVVQVGGALGAVIGAILLGGMLIRRFGRRLWGGIGRPGGVLEVLARYPLGRRQYLLILKMDRRVLLLHQSGTMLATLCEVREPGEVASLLARIEAGSSRGLAGRFHEALTQERTRFDSVETVDLTRSHNRHSARNFHRRQVAR